jgi:hypothetical protein
MRSWGQAPLRCKMDLARTTLSSTRAVEASKEWLKDHAPIPHEEVLAEFGLTLEDFERMGRTPLDPHSKGQ